MYRQFPDFEQVIGTASGSHAWIDELDTVLGAREQVLAVVSVASGELDTAHQVNAVVLGRRTRRHRGARRDPAGQLAREHAKVVLDQQLVAGIQPGVDNKASVEKLLGRPSFAGASWRASARRTRALSSL